VREVRQVVLGFDLVRGFAHRTVDVTGFAQHFARLARACSSSARYALES